METQHRIVVLGAGYAGASAAGRLARRLRPADATVTLVNAEPDFVERVRLHQLAAGQDLRSRPLAAMLAGTGAGLRVATVTGIGKLPAMPLRYYSQCVSLGRRHGLVQFVTADDRAVPAVLTGRLAALVKELICRGAAWAAAHPALGLPARRRPLGPGAR